MKKTQQKSNKRKQALSCRAEGGSLAEEKTRVSKTTKEKKGRKRPATSLRQKRTRPKNEVTEEDVCGASLGIGVTIL